MANLRILNVVPTSINSIQATFTDNLTSHLIAGNVNIVAASANTPNPQVLSVSVNGNTLTITTQPMTELAAYYVQFISLPQNPFQSTNGTAKILQDGVSNQFLIIALMDPDNPVKDYLTKYLANNIYDTTDGTVISSYLNSLSTNLARALYDIRQVQNENYLSFQIVDEQQFRGAGPFDRLYEEGVYEVMRVGLGPTNAKATSSVVNNDFPGYPITLQQQTTTETVQISSNDQIGTFNINNLTFNLSNSPITRVSSVIFTLLTANPVYTYNIDNLGYQLQSSRYDQDFASTYPLLEANQVQLNTQILDDPLFDINSIFKIDIQYQYKNLGTIIDPTSIVVYTTKQSIREVLPPLENVFSLAHAPITDKSNNAPILAGVSFLDPNSNTGSPHPAFINEIPFSLAAPPSVPGQYSINYPSATVYVYGADLTNDGTGASPPLATYYYQYDFINQIDYVYDVDLLDFVALPLGNLVGNTGTIDFNYEEVLVPGVDYLAETHIENISERIQNRLVALNSFTTLNSPITNIFQIYNETSGEIYSLERWTNSNQVYFQYNTPPRIVQQVGERASFEVVSNQLLFVNSVSTNTNSLRIFTILLPDNTIISSTEDGIGASFNTSLVFSNGNVFVIEKWYDQQITVANNINKLTAIGQYSVDYLNGIVYLAVSNTQQNTIGSVNYKKDVIVPQFPHILSVDDIYYQLTTLASKTKHFGYQSFDDDEIVPETIDPVDEGFLNGNIGAPYQLFGGQVGIFLSEGFVAGVSNQIKFIRSLYEFEDLTNSIFPINFANVSVSNNFNITVNSIIKQSFENVQFDGTNYFVLLSENIPYLSPNITYQFSVVRVSDGYDLWDNSGIIVAGDPLKLILSGVNNPQIGDLVNINYSFTINDLSRVIVDYNKGDYFVDYTYLADEILVSYEYGDNVLDFRQGNKISEGTSYYVSYRAGALRDALVSNFGSLVNLPELATLDTSFPRERYRDALMAALSSFLQGPTVGAIKNIGQIISHIKPQLIEGSFQTWSLGQSILYPRGIETTGQFQLLPAKYSSGVLVNQNNQTITLPANSNLRLEEGTFEQWIVPEWQGIDNDAQLTFTITKDGYSILPLNVFVGGGEYHPQITNNQFSLTKLDNATGKPNTNKDGIFIYYTADPTGNFMRWYVEVIDGYVAANDHTYKIKINSTGKFYDNKSLTFPQPSNMSIFTGTNSIILTITGGMPIDQGITFVSDVDHYFLDTGKKKDQSRLSIFKEASGYLNFRVWDKFKTNYTISADVSSWKSGIAHQIAASWKLNTRNNQDEMHLFIDGLEVPNIIKYNQKLQPYLHEKFRAINTEEISGLSDRDIIGSDDLTTTAGTNLVSSSVNFAQYNLQVGDILTINEVGFDPAGYAILGLNGQTLTLNSDMPITLKGNGKFSINQTAFVVSSDIDVAPNTAVSVISVFISGNDLTTTANSNIVSGGTNFTNQNVLPGYLIRINNAAPADFYTIVQVSGNNLTLSDPYSDTLIGAEYQIYSNAETELPGVRALDPYYAISQNSNFQNILTIFNGVLENDLVFIRTFGLNHRQVKKQTYIWSNEQEHILMTRLPPPISLNEADITKIIVPNTVIGINNSTFSGGIFFSNSIPGSNASNAQNGRTLQATISGTNVDFSTPVQITLNGMSGIYTISETITFTDYGTLNFANSYLSVSNITVNVKPINPNKNALAVEIREKYSITYSEFSGAVPVVRYSYQIGGGYNLASDGYGMVSDGYNTFSQAYLNNYLIINSPPQVAGYYVITGVPDRHTLTIEPTFAAFPLPLPNFSEGIYSILNVNQYRSGLQNGFFTLEVGDLPSQAYYLSRGFYELDYATYTQIKFDPINQDIYFGSDLEGHFQANAILDQTKIYSIMLLDTRVGETITNNQHSITKDYNSIKPLKSDSQTLLLINFDQFPFTNEATIYSNANVDRTHFQSDWAVNDNFDQSVVVLDQPILVPNQGILDTRKQATIEFWVSPLFDSTNDPNERYYFDAYGAVVEEATSVNDVVIKLSSPASQILSVKLIAGDPNIDYFAGGSISIDTQNAVQENAISIGNYAVVADENVLQVISVQIVGDLTNTDYFVGGSVSSDMKTIYLGRALPQPNLPIILTYQPNVNHDPLNSQIIRLNRRLPYQNSRVVVNYLPKGIQGDRISIYKEKTGNLNFRILASGQEFLISAPTFWAKNSWHRVKASYKINGGFGMDEMRLFIDGYQYSNVLYGEGLTYGKFPFVYGSSKIGDGYGFMGNIQFRDPINDLFIGTQYNQQFPIFALLDNFRISNISRPIYAPFGEPIDVNYNSNLSAAIPTTKDLYTTYLMDFNANITKTQSFTILTNREVGSFDFQVNIFDEFDIVSSSNKVKQTLEDLINTLKPANTTAFINYL